MVGEEIATGALEKAFKGFAEGPIRDIVKQETEKVKISIEGKLEVLDTKIDSLKAEIGSLRNEMKSEMARLDGKIDSLSEKVDIVKDVEKIKGEIKALQTKQS